jgi:hypothetical protein
VSVTFFPDAAAVVGAAAEEAAPVDEPAAADGPAAEEEPAGADEPAAGAAAEEAAAVVAAALLLDPELLPQAEVRATVPTAARVISRVVRRADEARIRTLISREQAVVWRGVGGGGAEAVSGARSGLLR